MVIIRQKTLREKRGIDVMAQLKASMLKAHGREDVQEMETTDCALVEPNAGAVLRAAMAVTAFRPGGDTPGHVDDDVRRRRRSMSLLTMAYRRNVPIFYPISFSQVP